MAFPADYTLDPNRELLASQIGAIRYIGILEIPALSLPIADDWQNDNFDLNPCRYTGSPYTDDLVVLGHNYASQLRALTGIAPGAAVTLYRPGRQRLLLYRLRHRDPPAGCRGGNGHRRLGPHHFHLHDRRAEPPCCPLRPRGRLTRITKPP